MADFNELYDIIDYYKEGYDDYEDYDLYDDYDDYYDEYDPYYESYYDDDYDDYYSEAASDPAAQEFNSIATSIKNNIKICKKLIKSKNKKEASKVINKMDSDCNKLDRLVDQIKNPNALDSCGKIIVGVSTLIGGALYTFMRKMSDINDRESFTMSYCANDNRPYTIEVPNDDAYRNYRKTLDSYKDNLSKYGEDDKRTIKAYTKHMRNGAFNKAIYNSLLNTDSPVKADMGRDLKRNSYVKSLLKGKSYDDLQKKTRLSLGLHAGMGSVAGGSISYLIMRKRKNVHNQISRLRKQIQKLKIALSKIA